MLGVSHDRGAAPKVQWMDAQIAALKNSFQYLKQLLRKKAVFSGISSMI